MALDLTKFSYALQEEYSTAKVIDVCARTHPFMAWLMANCKKQTSGEVHVYSIITETAAGRSAVFATAQGNAEGNKGAKFKVSCVQDYGVLQIDGNVIDAAEGQDKATFFDARVRDVDGLFETMGNSLSHSLWRSGSGSIGQIAASQNASSTTLVMKNANDCLFLQEGARLVADSVDGGGTVGTTVSFVKSIDIDAGTFTVSATLGGVAITATAADLTASQYIFVDGDYGEKVSGVAAWIPATVAQNDSFFGVNRSTNRARLAGYYKDASGVPTEQAILDAATILSSRSKAVPNMIFMSPSDWSNLNKSLSSKVIVTDVKPGADVNFGFQGIQLNGPRGVMTVVSDSDVLDGYCLITQKEAWQLIYQGNDVIRFSKLDGLTAVRAANSDAVEIRTKSNCNLCCVAPAFCAFIKLR